MKKLFLVKTETESYKWIIAKTKKEIKDFFYYKPISITLRSDLDINEFDGIATEL